VTPSACVDGGLGEAAIAAIAALPPGPRRDLEATTWARRILNGPARMAFVFPEDETARAAFAQLHNAIVREASRMRKGRR